MKIDRCSDPPPQVDNNSMETESFFTRIDNAVSLNPKSPDVNKVEQAVKSYVDLILAAMKRRNPLLDFSVIECGSFYEGLRVGAPYEFDFMLEINHFKAVEVVPQTSGQQLEHMEVKFVTSDSGQSSPHTGCLSELYAQAQLEFVKFRNSLVPAFRECVRRNERHKGLKVLEVSDHYNSPNFKLFLLYEGKKGVMIDLVPCVKFPIKCADKLPEFSESCIDFIHSILPQDIPTERHKALEYIAGQLYLVSTDLDRKWRISTSVLEFLIMKYLPHDLKRALRIIKYLCHIHLMYAESYETRYLDLSETLRLFGYKPFIPSYSLKLLFLHKIIELYTSENGLFRNKNDLERDILKTMLEYLRGFRQCGRLPVEKAKVEIQSFLFGEKHVHKFIFGQDLSLLAHDRQYSSCSQWYAHMLRKIAIIIESDGESFDMRLYKSLNYPPIEGVMVHKRSNMYI